MSKDARIIDRISSIQDHNIFFFIIFIGSIGIFLLRFVFGVPSYITLIWPVSLMFAYAFIVNNDFAGARLREDRAADNFYFMGFIFTVVSLSIALMRYTFRDAEVNQIIGDLGIGLFTTVVGLGGRIYFGQLRQDPEEIEQQTRLQLADAAKKTSAALISTNESIKKVQIHCRQIIDETAKSMDEVRNKIITSMEQLDNKINATNIPPDIISNKIDPMLDNLNQSISAFTEKIESIEVNPQVINQRAIDVFTPLDQSILVLKEKLQKLEVSPNFLKDQISPIINDISSLQSELGDQQKRYGDTMNQAFSGLNKNQESVTRFANDSEKLHQNLSSFGTWAASITENESKLTDLNKTLEAVNNSLNSSSKNMLELSDMSLSRQQEYQQGILDLQEELNQTTKSISDLSNNIQELGAGFIKVMRELTELAEESSK